MCLITYKIIDLKKFSGDIAKLNKSIDIIEGFIVSLFNEAGEFKESYNSIKTLQSNYIEALQLDFLLTGVAISINQKVIIK